MRIVRAIAIGWLAFVFLSSPFRLFSLDREVIYLVVGVTAGLVLIVVAIWLFGRNLEPPPLRTVEPNDARSKKADEDNGALREAIRYGYKAIVEKLVAAGADVNREHMGTTPVREAILFGRAAIARFLIDHGAELRALNHFFDPNAEDIVTKLFYDGEGALAQKVGKAVTGVHIPQPDGELLAKGQRLGSLFLAIAARFKREGDLASAQLLCEWKIEHWKAHPFDEEYGSSPSLEQMYLCLRTLAEIKETQGHLEEALRLCRNALQVLAWALRLPANDVEFAPMILDEADTQALFTDTWLQSAIDIVSADNRAALIWVLRNCERLLRKLDPSQVEEQPGAADRVAAALQQLEGTIKRAQAKNVSEGLELKNPPSPPVERLRGDDPDVIRAAQLGKFETVKQLIGLGARLDVPGCGRTDDSALMAAVRSGSKETVEALIAAGADVNRGIERDYDDPIVETALTVAVASGNLTIVKLLLDHRADVNVLNHYYRPNAEETVALLFEMGEGAHARDLGQAATGVDLPPPDADLFEQARRLGSLFVAFADRFETQGDRVSATRLCEWKVAAWENQVWVDDEGGDEDPRGMVRVPIHISLCLRTLGQSKEAEGELQEALRLYRKALGTWRRSGQLVDAAVLDNPWLQFTLGLVPEGRRSESAALMSDCERILGRLGLVEEQRRVTVALQRLRSEKP